MASRRTKALLLHWMWLATLIPPIVYGGTAAAVVHRANKGMEVGTGQFVVLMGAKWFTYPSLLVLSALVARQLVVNRRRPLAAAGVWSLLGAAAVVAAAQLHPPAGRGTTTSAFTRIWPTQSSQNADNLLREVGPFGPSWNVPGMEVREIMVLAVLALVTALLMRNCVRHLPAADWVVGPVAVLAGLLAYAYVTPWALSQGSHEIVLGDVLLGGTLAELLMPAVPLDPLAAAALGAAALSMGGLLLAWREQPAIARPGGVATASAAVTP